MQCAVPWGGGGGGRFACACLLTETRKRGVVFDQMRGVLGRSLLIYGYTIHKLYIVYIPPVREGGGAKYD